MKRPIKFRGIAVDTGEMVYGNLIQEEDVSTIVYYANEDDEEPIFHRVIPETVGQFTGLLDKNGKEIFEGDVVEFETKLGIYEIPLPVEFHPTKGFRPYYKGIGGFEDWYWWQSTVIGNLYEHPELITP